MCLFFLFHSFFISFTRSIISSIYIYKYKIIKADVEYLNFDGAIPLPGIFVKKYHSSIGEKE